MSLARAVLAAVSLSALTLSGICAQKTAVQVDRHQYWIGYHDMTTCDDPRGQYYNWRTFGSTRDGAAALYVANADGSDPRPVTVPKPGSAQLRPHWRPLPTPPPPTVQRFHIHDFALTNTALRGNPFRVRLSATFTNDSGVTLRKVPGFYDGNNTWKIRFSPPEEGTWTGIASSDQPALDGIILPPVVCVSNRNPSVHGLLHIDAKHCHRFAWSDGTPFIPLGFELDWLAAFHQRLGQPKGQPVDRTRDQFTPAMDLLVRRGFNYLTSCLYAYKNFTDPAHPYALTPPDLYCFGGSNEQPDHSVLNVDFFKDFDGAIAATHERGIAVNLMLQVLNKEVNWPKLRSEEDDAFWQYVTARYQAYGNIIWDVGKESFRWIRADPDHGRDYILSRIQLIRGTDAYGHLVTAHDNEVSSAGRNTAVDAVCDFVSDQISLWKQVPADAASIARDLNRETIRRFRSLSKPYITIEYGYEKGVETIPTVDMAGGTRSWQDLLLWTWALYAGGGHANYYYNNTSWNLVKFWPESPGWERYGFLRQFLNLIDLRPMVPDNELARRGMCLSEYGRQYFVFLPEGGDDILDLAMVKPPAELAATWMDIFTGERARAVVKEPKFRTGLKNPLPNPTNPCVFYIQAASRERVR
jgi:hypothetical protein